VSPTSHPFASFSIFASALLYYANFSYSKIAEHISKAAPSSKTVLIDTFGGVGGNAIAFAASGRWDRIFAIEQDPQKIKCAKHNAEIYGVAGKIWWIQGDCFEMLKKRFSKMGEAVIFASPPWGGMFHYSPIEPLTRTNILTRE